jgi:hypothetical protein
VCLHAARAANLCLLPAPRLYLRGKWEALEGEATRIEEEKKRLAAAWQAVEKKQAALAKGRTAYVADTRS